MPAAAKKTRSRKVVKDTASTRQTSLLDVFSVRSSSKKNTPSTSAAASETGSVAGDEVIDILSSDAEPLEERPMDSSSPFTGEEGSEEGGLSETASVTSGHESQPGGSWEAPIIVADSSPVASPIVPTTPLSVAPRLPAPPKPLYSLFAPRKRPDERASSRVHDDKHSARLFVPYPDGTNQHVRGPQTVYSASLTDFSRHHPHQKSEALSLADMSIYSRLVSLLAEDPCPNTSGELTSVDVSTGESIIDNIPLNHRSYPAIARLLQVSSSGPSSAPDQHIDANSLWTHKWRPKSADQVLGNERSALYLREWLLALKLHISGDDASASSTLVVDKNGKQKAKKAKGPRGTKRPRVVRDVERKRRRIDSEEPEEPWIAEDSEGDDPLDVIGLSEDDPASLQLSRLKRATGNDLPDIKPVDVVPEELPDPPTDDIPPFSYTLPKFGDVVYNTLLLTGPSGCGKTVAVYACADELGWEVFEVYPGIGERSGSAMQKLIGEVGKNHLVTQNQQQSKTGKGKARDKAKLNFFTKRVVSDDEGDNSDAQVPSSAAETEDVAKHAQTPTEVNQSIVLVEEVDILYREDANFWPTMIKIIKECRRPVVLTCNDLSLVPLSDLPLQTVLQFNPCPTGLATSYLKLLCLSEGRVVEHTSLQALYETSLVNARLQPDQDRLLHAQYLPPPQPDLRRSLTQLQLTPSNPTQSGILNCETQKCVVADNQSPEMFKRMAKAVETRSTVNSGLRRPASAVFRDLMANNSSPSADDVIGFTYLVAEADDFDSHLPVTFSTYDRDDAIRQYLLTYCQEHFPSPDDPPNDTSDLPPLHTSHCGTLLPILDRLHVAREQLVRDPAAIFVDYEPWIRYMVRADDTRISAYLASGLIESTTRRTRNSQRSQWECERWVPLDDHERNTLMMTAFDRDTVGNVLNVAVTRTDPELPNSM